MDSDHLIALVEGSDLNGLVRFIDGIVTDRDWDGLVELRDRCLEATERGKQLWGAAQFAEYRIALDAPGPYAGAVVREGAGRYALGPLWEVAASTHTWAELESHIGDRRSRALVAGERAIRGETIADDDVDDLVLEIPLNPFGWEPSYPTADYRADRANFPEYELPEMRWVELPAAAVAEGGDPLVCDALLDLVKPWTEESSGRAECRAVVGSAVDAIRALGPHRVRLTEVDLGQAVALLTWVGAGGGAYGRRRGTPIGRAAAWWTVSSLLGMEDDWPPDPAVLAQEATELRWFAWDPGDRVGGWNFHLAIEDPAEGLAWAVSAVDWK